MTGSETDFKSLEPDLRKFIASSTITSPKVTDQAKIRRVKFTIEYRDEDSLCVQVEVRARFDADKITKKLKSLASTADGGRVPGFEKVTMNDDVNVDKHISKLIRMEEEMHKLTGRKPADDGDTRRLFSSHSEGHFGAPLSILSISATVLPVFYRVADEGKEAVGTYVVEGGDEYVGFTSDRSQLDIEPFSGGYLTQNEIRGGRNGNEFWSDQVEMLYRDAHPESPGQQRPGVLLLDAVNPRCE